MVTTLGNARMNILFASGSLRDLPAAVAALEDPGHCVACVDGPADPSQADARVIALHTSGSDNVELARATWRGIVVANAKRVNAEQCAELSLGLLLAVTRQNRTGDIAIRPGIRASRTRTSLGLIGRAAVRRLRAFGVRLLCHARTPALGEEMGMAHDGLDTLLRESDLVSPCASLNERPRRMVGAREIGPMKPGAHPVNIARGEPIDEPALPEALRTRRIADAGRDVVETDPLLDGPFLTLDNLVLTLRQAGLAASARARALRDDLLAAHAPHLPQLA